MIYSHICPIPGISYLIPISKLQLIRPKHCKSAALSTASGHFLLVVSTCSPAGTQAPALPSQLCPASNPATK